MIRCRIALLLLITSLAMSGEVTGEWLGIKTADGTVVELRQEGDRKLSVRIGEKESLAAISVPVVGSLSQIAISPWVKDQYVSIFEVSSNEIYSYLCVTFGMVEGKITPSMVGHIVTMAHPLTLKNLTKEQRGDGISADLISKSGIVLHYEHGCPNPPLFGTLTIKDR